MRQTKATKVMALMLSMVMITSVFVGNTLSRYVTSVSSTDSARVAVWGINGGENEMNLFDTKYLVAGKKIAESNNKTDKIIAPGAAGEAEFNIINFEQDVPPEVAYEVSISLDDSEMNAAIKNNPSIQWKLDNGAFGTWDQLKTSILSLAGNESGKHTYAPGQFATAFQGTQTHKIAWQWVMDNSNNTMDTEMGNAALDGEIKAVVKVSITAQQIDDLVTNEHMLDGMNQVINVNDLQPAVFRSAAPSSELQEVRVNNNPVNPSNYDVEEGSTIITLHKDYLESLGTGRYTIDIVSTSITASTVFSIEEAPVVHNGIIPEGAVYYKGLEENEIGHFDIWNYEKYISNLTKYVAGTEFPELETGDIYVYGDYVYGYNVKFDYPYVLAPEQNGWFAIVGKGFEVKTEYDNLLTSINGKDLVNIEWLFFDNQFIEKAPKIPDTVVDIGYTFNSCINLTGIVEINANIVDFDWAFSNTEKPIVLVGSSNNLSSIANNYNNVMVGDLENEIDYNSLFHYGIIPEGGMYFVGAFYDIDSASTVLVSGQDFPEFAEEGDVYIFENYRYQLSSEHKWVYSCINEPGDILRFIAGRKVDFN